MSLTSYAEQVIGYLQDNGFEYAEYAEQVIGYLQDNGFEYAEPDARGGTFPGGILMDIGGGRRIAFFMPAADIHEALRSLAGYLDDVYPGGNRVRDLVEVGEIRHATVLLNTAVLYEEPELATSGSAA